MTKPVAKAETLVTDDGVPIEAVHLAGDRGLGFVVAHGFTLNWQVPHLWRVANRLNLQGGVVAFDFRGHGRSGGATTLGDKEINDVDAAVRYMRDLGYGQVVTVGFSMGASIVLRHAGLIGGVDAAVSVSGPGRWYYRGTPSMRRVHWAVEHKIGRMLAKRFMNTRISQGRWDPVPLPPAEAAALIAPTPLLIVHGDRDEYFPADHSSSRRPASPRSSGSCRALGTQNRQSVPRLSTASAPGRGRRRRSRPAPTPSPSGRRSPSSAGARRL
jgi:pimeloyl-ACP methyl ester carboxylesterase